MTNVKNDPVLSEIVKRLSEALPAKKIFLFGSRVNGQPHADSDYDLLVLVGSGAGEPGQLIDKGHYSLKGVRAFVDLLVMGEDSFNEQLGILSSIPEIVTTEGIEVYAA